MTADIKAQEAQDIFRKVIGAGYYHGDGSVVPSSVFMCHALDQALNAEFITLNDYSTAKSEIEECLDRSNASCISLSSALRSKNPDLFNADSNYTEIYWNWADRRPF